MVRRPLFYRYFYTGRTQWNFLTRLSFFHFLALKEGFDADWQLLVEIKQEQEAHEAMPRTRTTTA